MGGSSAKASEMMRARILKPAVNSFDVRSVKKTCVPIVHPDGRLIPFDTYNLFYRDDLERTRLAPLRERAEAAQRLPQCQQSAVS